MVTICYYKDCNQPKSIEHYDEINVTKNLKFTFMQ